MLLIAGSVGLVLQGAIQREVHDIDVVTLTDFYHYGGFYNNRRSDKGSNSHKFMNGQDQVRAFNVYFDDLKVDVLYNTTNPPKWKEIEFRGKKIRVEDPQGAINAKIGYVENDTVPESRLKHLADLIEMGIDKQTLLKIARAKITSHPYSGTPTVKREDPLISIPDDDIPY